MTFKNKIYVLAISVLGITGCGSKPATKANLNLTKDEPKTQKTEQKDAQEKQQSKSSTKGNVTGELIKIEDSAYPMFNITVALVDLEKNLSLNIESIGLSIEELYALEGKQVAVTYKSISEESLIDMEYEGKSLLTGKPIDIDQKWQSITGRLEGADVATMSDLPGQFYIIAENGESKAFEYFISAEMTLANMQIVTAFFGIREYDKVNSLHAVTKN